jgi:hypothetical protein
MVRYSFLVGLFHPRLHAGLSRRLRRGRDGRYQPPPAQTRACGATAHGSYFGCAHVGSVESAFGKTRRLTLRSSSRALSRTPCGCWSPVSSPTLSWVGCQPSCCSPQSPVFPPPPPPPVSPLTLFGSFAGTTPMFDSSPAFMHGLCFWLPVPIRRLVSPGCRRGLSVLAPSRYKHTVGARIAFFEAQFPARRCLCLRFTRHLTAPSARLEVKMVRYSFLVGLFHPRLHAGLSRRLHLLTRVAR